MGTKGVFFGIESAAVDQDVIGFISIRSDILYRLCAAGRAKAARRNRGICGAITDPPCLKPFAHRFGDRFDIGNRLVDRVDDYAPIPLQMGLRLRISA